jgi:rod shape determining protein RodA
MCALLMVGFVNLFSTAGAQLQGWNSFTRQIVFSGLGFLVLAGSLFFDYRILKALAWPLFCVSIVLVVLAKYHGITVNGATRWLPLGTDALRFQPSEFMKIATVFALASFLSSRDRKGGLGILDLVFPVLLVALPCYVILKQPDVGTALHLGLTVIPIFIIRRIKTAVLAALAFMVVIGGSWVLFFGGLDFLLRHEVIKEYHLERYETFRYPEKDPNGKGWQITQSKNAIGSGQMNGRGYMEGSQQKHGFLPAAETDFAFAALAEEWGFVGSGVTILLFFALIWAALSGASRSGDMFGSLLSVGLASLLFFQMAINVAMVTGLMPVVGIPLPFISYGGTSSVMNIMCVAAILNVGMRRYRFMEAPLRQNPELWEKAQPSIHDAQPVSSLRRLAPPNPNEPDHHPVHRLPHYKPWLKHLAPKNWVQQQQLMP